MKAGTAVSSNTSEISGGYFKTLAVSQILQYLRLYMVAWLMNYKLERVWGGGGRNLIEVAWRNTSVTTANVSAKIRTGHLPNTGPDRSLYKTLIFLFKLYRPLYVYSCIRHEYAGSFVRTQASAK